MKITKNKPTATIALCEKDFELLKETGTITGDDLGSDDCIRVVFYESKED